MAETRYSQQTPAPAYDLCYGILYGIDKVVKGFVLVDTIVYLQKCRTPRVNTGCTCDSRAWFHSQILPNVHGHEYGDGEVKHLCPLH